MAPTPIHCIDDNVSPSQKAAETAATKASDSIKIPTRPGETYCMIRKISKTDGKNTTTDARKAGGMACKNAKKNAKKRAKRKAAAAETATLDS